MDKDEEPRFEGGDGPRFEGGDGPRFEGEGEPRFEGEGGPRFEGEGGPRFEGEGGPRFEGGGGPRFEGGRRPRFEGGVGPRFEGGCRPRFEGGVGPRFEGGIDSRFEGRSGSRLEDTSTPRLDDQGQPRLKGKGRRYMDSRDVERVSAGMALMARKIEDRTLRPSRNRKRRNIVTDSDSSVRGDVSHERTRKCQRMSRTRRGGSRWTDRSTGSSDNRESIRVNKSSRNRNRESETNVLLDNFSSILSNVKSSEKPKLSFNSNVLPDFDCLSKEQTMLVWITKVEECAEIYGWSEKEIIHYALPKLSRVAKTWYQGLSSLLYTWGEWKKKLIESFPCREDYAELLTEMLAKRAKYGESLEHYYYAKLNLLNRCKIYGKHAVDCVIYGVDDRTKFGGY